MTTDEYLKKLEQKFKQLELGINTQLMPRIALKAVAHYKSNFRTQSFDGKPWAEVNRRKTESEWYGFDYKGEKRTYYAITKAGKKAKKQKKLNYSSAATKRKILTGSTGELGNSVTARAVGFGVRVYSPKPYAKVHNQGGIIKVFGKATRTLPARPFIGKSAVFYRETFRPMAKEYIHKQLNNQ